MAGDGTGANTTGASISEVAVVLASHASVIEGGSTRAAPVGLQPSDSDIDGHCHNRGLLGELLPRPYDNIFPVDTRDMKDDPL
jgi:hypothetical protein